MPESLHGLRKSVVDQERALVAAVASVVHAAGAFGALEIAAVVAMAEASDATGSVDALARIAAPVVVAHAENGSFSTTSLIKNKQYRRCDGRCRVDEDHRSVTGNDIATVTKHLSARLWNGLALLSSADGRLMWRHCKCSLVVVTLAKANRRSRVSAGVAPWR